MQVETASYWRLICNAKNEKNTHVLCNRLFKQLRLKPLLLCVEALGSRGHQVSWRVVHPVIAHREWVWEVLVLAQRVSRSWQLSGNILDYCSGYSNRIQQAGIVSIEWHVGEAPWTASPGLLQDAAADQMTYGGDS